LVAVLMQRQPRAGLVTIDETGFGAKVRKACLRGRLAGQFAKYRRHLRPRLPRIRIDRVIAITAAIGHPAEAAAIGHRHRHLVATGREHAAEGRLSSHRRHSIEQIMLDRPREAAQDHRALADRLAGWQNVRAVKQIRSHFASWKITPTVWRRPERNRLTPWRRLTR